MTKLTPRTARPIEQLERRPRPLVSPLGRAECLAAAGALEGAVHLVDDDETANVLARTADQWRRQAERSADRAAVQRFLAFLVDHDCAVVHLDHIGLRRFREAEQQHAGLVDGWAEEDTGGAETTLSPVCLDEHDRVVHVPDLDGRTEAITVQLTCHRPPGHPATETDGGHRTDSGDRW